ncbi:MAG: hypothetical protein J2P17_15490 [Mycobacterium sp.]|nr:hypothetical protein [Mycobacterium sp.]
MNMDTWRSSSGQEVADLAARLCARDWTWRMADAAELAAEFGWPVRSTRPRSVAFDVGFGTDSGTILGRDGKAEIIRVAVTSRSRADEQRVHAAFGEILAVLRDRFGQPRLDNPGNDPEARWPVADTTLRLVDLGVCVELGLVTNFYLAVRDRAIESEGRESS